MVTRIFIFFGIIHFLQDQWKDVYKESAWNDRDTWQRPSEIIDRLKLKRGSHVADIGCHEGYLTVKLSMIVGKPGKVYAVDTQQSKLDRLIENLAKRKIENVEIVKGEEDDPKLPDGLLDAVVIMDTYHELNEPLKILLHIKKALKSGGRLLLCEAIADDRRKLSRKEQEGKHELEINFAIEDLKKAGFTILEEKDRFVDRSKIMGDYMWLLVAKK